jgi:hypothetical protein
VRREPVRRLGRQADRALVLERLVRADWVKTWTRRGRCWREVCWRNRERFRALHLVDFNWPM